MSCSKHPLALFNGSYLGGKPTGIGVVARDLAAELDPELVSLLDPLAGTRPGSIPIPNNLMPDCGSKGHLRRLIWTQNKVPELLKQSGAQIFLSPLPEAPLFRRIKSVVLVHDLLPLRYPQLTPLLAYHLTYVPLVLNRAVRILCNSEATAREVHYRLGIPSRKLLEIPLGFDQGKLCPLRLQREPFFLVLGRHDPHKNLVRALYAFSLLRGNEFQLWFVGPQDRRYTPRLKHVAKTLGIENSCKWIPWVSDEEKNKLLNRCQALLIPSLWEGFGLPALEAMACETPIIASSAGALPEVVSDAAIVIDPRNPNEIADALMKVSLDNSLRKTLINNGKNRLKNYTWSKSAKLVEQILKELTN